jgi:formylglycine-generating enzyme required for sulfatase activity
LKKTKQQQEPIFSMLGEIDIDSPEPGMFADTSSVGQEPLPADGVGDVNGPASTMSAVTAAQEDREASASPANGHGPAADRPAHLPHDGSSDLLSSWGFLFAAVPAGAFMMGSPEDEPGRNPDETQHEVTLARGFYLQTTLVTQKQWKLVMGKEPSVLVNEGDACPVTEVSWDEVQEFLKKLNARGDARYRLPTEAEWEYACRAGTASAFASGDIAERFCGHDPCLDAVGWYCGNSGRKVHAVARKASNAWGLYDMHGNVWEWCQDWYGEYPAAPQRDPLGPAFGPGRVVRGGCWHNNAQNSRSACRFYLPPNSRSDFLGFRLVREAS